MTLAMGLGLGLALPLGGRGGGRPRGGTLLVIGDSIAGGHAVAAPITSISVSGTTATVTRAAHGLSTGDIIYGPRATNEAINGRHTITRVDADTYTFPVPSGHDGSVTARRGSFNAYRIALGSDLGPGNWISALRDGCFDVVGVHAESGCNSTYLPTLIANSAGVDCEWVLIICGINDIAGSGTAEGVAGNIINAADALIAGGNRVIVTTPGPVVVGGAWTTEKRDIAKACAELLRAYVASTSKAYLLDTYAAGTSDGETPIAGLLQDAVHPSAFGAYRYAKQFLADHNIVSPYTWLPASAQDDVTVDAGSPQRWPNPMLTGTGGSKPGASPATGDVANGHNLLALTAGSVTVGSKAGDGSIQRVVVETSALNDGIEFYSTTSKMALADSESVRAVAQVTVTTADGELRSCALRCASNYGAGDSTAAAALTQSFTTYPQLDGETLTLVTPRRVIPSVSAMTGLRPFLTVRAADEDTLTIDVRRPALWADR